MFFSEALRIAATKAGGEPHRLLLERALTPALELERIEAEFEQKINASKARRGERPTKLPKARKQQLRGYAEDAQAMAAEQLALFRAQLDPLEIAGALHAGLLSDLEFWRQAGKHTHPQDMPLVHELVGAKARLLEALAQLAGAAGGGSA